MTDANRRNSLISPLLTNYMSQKSVKNMKRFPEISFSARQNDENENQHEHKNQVVY